jgi:hypothetical protein
MGDGKQEAPEIKQTRTRQRVTIPKWLRPIVKDFYQEYAAMGRPVWEPSMFADIPNVPPTDYLAPTGNWWGSLDPQIKAGIQAPWMEQEARLRETFGPAGSPRGGFSGAFADALSDLWAQKAVPQMAMQGWNMMQPSLMQRASLEQAAWNEQMMRDRMMWGEQQKAMQYPYNLAPALFGQTTMQPYAYWPQQSGGMNYGGAATGALSGAATGAMAGSVFPGIGTGIGAIGGGLIGGLGGLFSNYY